jgi:hypothetical protein
MLRRSPATLWLALIALLAVPALPVASSQAPRKPAGKKASKQAAEAPRPPLPQELPPVAPTVTYRGGLLTIVAENSTLQDILTGVRKATGATVDAPAASAGERVVTHLGPGQPRDVLAALLNGSRFDYILLSSPENPGGLRRLILSPRSGSGASGSGAAAAAAPTSPPGSLFSQPAHPVPAVRTPPPEADEGESEAPEETVEPAQEVAPEPEPQAPPPQPELKTPQQIQDEFLRRQQEQQQQQPQQPQQPPPQ